MKHLRHQPLLLWSISLLVMLAFIGIGNGAEEASLRLPEARPAAMSGQPHAQEILRSLPGAHSALAAGELDSWGADLVTIATKGRSADAGTPRQAQWDAVLSTVTELTAADAAAQRVVVLDKLGLLGRQLMELSRSYR